jgi:hypothetical protein
MMKLQTSDWFAATALLVSIVSIGISLYATLRDRVKIKAFSNLYTDPHHNPHTWIVVTVVNHGRRTAVLTRFGGDFKGEGWQSTPLGDKGLGLHLAENEYHRIDLTPYGVLVGGKYVDLWFEDSLGRRHRVKNARKHLQEMNKIFGLNKEPKATLNSTP